MKKYLILFILIVIQGCSSGGDDNDTVVNADTSGDDTANDADTSGNDTTIEPLTFYEKQLAGDEQLVGKWVYYHNYDASYRYLIFMADRTGCAFEITSSEDRVDYEPYGHWELLDSSEPEVFTISVTRSDYASTTTSNTYDYAESRILRGSSGEVMFPYATSRVCD